MLQDQLLTDGLVLDCAPVSPELPCPAVLTREALWKPSWLLKEAEANA